MSFPLPAADLVIPTVTPNPALGRTLFVDAIVLNRRNPVRDRLLTASGKGINASLVLAGWGVQSAALGFAAGDSGQLHARMLRAQGVEPDYVWVGGETRTNVMLIEAATQTVTTFADDTLDVAPEQATALVERFTARLRSAGSATLGGPLPHGATPALYVRLLAAARAQGVPVVVDAFAPGFEQWMGAGAAWIKPNRFELEMLAGVAQVATAQEALAHATRLHAALGANLLVSLDVDGAVAVAGGRCYRIPPLAIDVVSAEGAGDAMVSGLAVALARRLPDDAVIRLAVAAGAAAVTTSAVGVSPLETVAALWPAVQVLPEGDA